MNIENPAAFAFTNARLRPDPMKSHLVRKAARSALADALERGDVNLVLGCLKALAELHGMSWTADQIGVHRTALYRMLRAGSNPKIGTILGLLDAFNIRVTLAAD